MLPFEEARRLVLASCAPLPVEEVTLTEAAERVLAEDLRAEHPLPPFDYSAMDGFALACADLSGEPPFELPIRGEARAGSSDEELLPGTVLRIFTGAELPRGADAVIIQEMVSVSGDTARFEVRPRAFDNVRRAGEDLPSGALALAAGSRLGPFALGLVAALDRATVLVRRRPRVVLVTTGDELRPPGSARRPGSVPDSNAYAIRAMATRAGAEVLRSVHVADDLAEATRSLAELAASADVLVTLGGVSVGRHDVVRPALAAAGAELAFWKVALKPGKPFTFGKLGPATVLGLPGNPVSAQVTFALFGMPLLRALQGDRQPVPKGERVVLDSTVHQKPGRLGVYRALLDGRRAILHANQASGSTLSLAHADALVFVPAEVAEREAGSEVEALRLSEL